jgi:hypothetical protein
MPAAIDRIHPFHAKHSRPGRYSARPGLDRVKSSPTVCDQRLGYRQAAGRVAKIAQIAEYLFKAFRRKPQDLRLAGKRRQ